MIIEIQFKNGEKLELSTVDEPVTSDWIGQLMDYVTQGPHREHGDHAFQEKLSTLLVTML